LHVGRIAVLPERPLDDDLELCLDVFLDRSVDRRVVFDLPVEDDGEFAEFKYRRDCQEFRKGAPPVAS